MEWFLKMFQNWDIEAGIEIVEVSGILYCIFTIRKKVFGSLMTKGVEIVRVQQTSF